jgi:TetR/AcrR family transcriptional regulator, repressor for uid operon
MGDGDTRRERVLEGALVCVGRSGLAKTTVDDVARESGVSRATIYRYFPRGREQLVAEMVACEMGRFFRRLGEAVAGAADLATLLEDALVFAYKALADHEGYQKVLVTEPDRLLPLTTVQADRLLPLIAGFLVPYLERDRDAGRLRPTTDLDRTAAYIARMFLTLINTPGCWDLEDRDQVGELVRDHLLAGVLAP